MKNNTPLKGSKNAYFSQYTQNAQLWIPLVIGVLFSGFILMSLDVPDVIRVSMEAKKAMVSLDNVRQQLIEIQKIELLSIEPHDDSATINKLDEVIADNQLVLAKLKQNTAYNIKLSIGIAQFLKVYHTWMDKKYLLHSDRIMNASHLFEHASINQLFLTAMTLLHKCEQHLHTEINNGMKALNTIKWVLIILVAYIAIVAFLYQRLALNKFKTQGRQLYVILQTIGDAVITTNLQGQVMDISAEAEKLTGISQDEAIGKPFATIFKTVTIHEDEVLAKKQAEDNTTSFSNDVLLRATNGRQYRVINSGEPIDDESGHITGIVHIFRDVTEERSLQNKILQQARLLK